MITKEEVKDIVEDVVFKSHSSVASVTSNAFGEIKRDIALIKKDLQYIKEDNNRRNGAFVKAVEGFTQKIENLDAYRSYTTGAVAVIIPIVGFLAYEVIHLLQEIKTL